MQHLSRQLMKGIVMKAVGEFKKAGLEFVEGDECTDCDGVNYHVNWFHSANSGFETFIDSSVKKFSWRENTGVKPEFNGLIDFTHKDGTEYFSQKVGSRHCSEWGVVGGANQIAKWRPSLNQSSVAETDTKQSAIHNAWVALGGNVKAISERWRTLWCVSGGRYVNGEYYHSFNDKCEETGAKFICTKQEFTSYCEKMAAEEKRMDIIGQNGNDGLHYGKTAQQVEALAMKKPSEKMKVALDEADKILAKFSNDKPVFTQAMADAGEFPPVGSEVSIRYKFDSKQIHITGTVLYSSLEHCIIDGKHKECHYKMCDYIYEAADTRTDREKAIDKMFEDAKVQGSKGAFERLYDAGYRKC